MRTKLARNRESTAVCIAESVSHALLSSLGFRVAEAFNVQVSDAFAADLTAQYRFDDPVRPGRHWGTRLMQRDVQEIEFVPEIVDRLANPGETFELYLSDVLLGNPDRRTFGNVLLAHRQGDTRFDLLPIDQSDAFFHPATMLDEELLRRKFDASGAEMLPGTEGVLVAGGVDIVPDAFQKVSSCRDRISGFVREAADEWFDETSVDPDMLVEFLEYRTAKLDVLAQRDHWAGIPHAAGDKYVLDLDP